MLNPSPATLLSKEEPSPFEVAGRDGRSPFVVTCDHAGRLLPRGHNVIRSQIAMDEAASMKPRNDGVSSP